jgi:hypothetical protein
MHILPVTVYETIPITIDSKKFQAIYLGGLHVVSMSIDPTFGEFDVFSEGRRIGTSEYGTYKFTQPPNAATYSLHDRLVACGVPEIGADARNFSNVQIKMIQHPDHPVFPYSECVHTNLLIVKLNFYIIDNDGIGKFLRYQ